MKKWMAVLATLSLLAAVDTASAAHGRKQCAPTCYTPSCGYTYVTTYQDVTRTICEYVPVTTTQDVTEVVCTPVKKVVPQTETYYENVIVNVPVERTVYRCVNQVRKEKVAVCRPVTRTVEQTYQVCVPVTKTVKQTYQVCVPVTKTVKQTYQVCVPVTKSVEQTYYTTVYDKVAVQRTGYHTSYVTSTVCAPVATCGSAYSGCGHRHGCCSPCVSYAPQTVCTPVCTPYTYTAYQCVARQVAQKQMVNYVENTYQTRTQDVQVVENTFQTRTQDVQVVENTFQTRKQSVPVTTYETAYVDQDVTYQVMQPTVEKFTVQQCKAVAKTRTFNVEYTEYKTSHVTKKVPVTTYKMVTRTVVEKVPVTTCVPVAPIAVAPACAPAPCCY